MANAFELLVDPTRRRLLVELREGDCSVGTLVERLEMSQPAVSKQLRVLREAGLASVRREAQRRIYRNLSTTMGHSAGLIREQCPVW